MHVALDPRSHLHLLDDPDDKDQEAVDTLTHNLKTIVSLLADKGADPNIRNTGDPRYTNPPMTGGVTGLTNFDTKTVLEAVRAQLVLTGADPTQPGSCFYTQEGASGFYKGRILGRAFLDYAKVAAFGNAAELEKLNSRLHPSVREDFAERFDALQEVLLKTDKPEAEEPEPAQAGQAALFRP
ncbi:MAG: hypothetical protein K0U23_01400 [Gammaproteobacteria bacterium]|nr:hypothetical protein [Gammaproteobacteria bacterium]